MITESITTTPSAYHAYMVITGPMTTCPSAYQVITIVLLYMNLTVLQIMDQV